VYAFVGRSRELSELDRQLDRLHPTSGRPDGPGASSAVVISAISGTAGVGKTALAVHWAHRVADRFPDGQLYVNLRGFDPGGQAMDPSEAIRGCLDALAVPTERLPGGLDAQSALYRSTLADKRVLVVLDNARDAAQARPLLPGTPTALVIVTSRDRLTGLVAADGAYPIKLDLLSTEEGADLLASRVGVERVAAEPAAVDDVVAACAQLPLALTIAAARAATNPSFGLATLATELTEARDRLDTLTAGEPSSDIRAVFSWSYRALTAPAARLFRLLGLHPGRDISALATASLAGHPLPRTRQLLSELTSASLLTEHLPGRYSFHDLLRAYATDLTHGTDAGHTRLSAIDRLLDHYLHSAHAADRLLHPSRDVIPVQLAPAAAGVTPQQHANQLQAMSWLTAEHSTLLAALRLAVDSGRDTQTWQLAWALDTFLSRQGHWNDLAAGWQSALRAADRLADPSARAHAHRLLASAYTLLGAYPGAHIHHGYALDLHTEAGDLVGQARSHLSLGYLRDRQGHAVRALDHAEQALILFRAAGHDRGQAYALNAVGYCRALNGDYAQALIHCQQALGLHQQLDDRAGEAQTWDSLGYAYHELGHYSQAIDCYQQALDLFGGLGDRYDEATTLTSLGETQHAGGDSASAQTTWQLALAILTELNHPDAASVRTKLHSELRV
jgi:tetratricopeptide (TPR) repeat protein